MKAANIIHELTVNDYNGMAGVITVEKGDNPWNAFCVNFGKQIEEIYSPYSTAEIVQKGERNFVYIYDDKFPNRDKELYAILRDYDDEHHAIIYLYEIE